MSNEADKTVKFSISMPESISQALDSSRGTESRSSYIQRLLQSGQQLPAANDPHLLEQLFAQYLPIRAEEASEALKQWPNLKQKKLVHDILEAAIDYLDDHYEHSGKVVLMPDTSARFAKDLLRVAEDQHPYNAEAAADLQRLVDIENKRIQDERNNSKEA